MPNKTSHSSLTTSFSWETVFQHYDWNPRERFNVAMKYVTAMQKIQLALLCFTKTI